MSGRPKGEKAHEGLKPLGRLWELLEINKDDRSFTKGIEEYPSIARRSRSPGVDIVCVLAG
ncbi:hypothetical protein BDW75DRAFT_206257 [Aspergillus navahoensis]